MDGGDPKQVSPPDLRFRRANRLLDPASFQRVFDKPDYRVSSRHFLCLALKNDLPQQRLGMVIARKRARRAVDRALIKRHLRESVRQRPDSLAGLDIVVLLRSNLSTADSTVLRDEILSLWDKLLAKRQQA